jgi:hypothetical protein
LTDILSNAEQMTRSGALEPVECTTELDATKPLRMIAQPLAIQRTRAPAFNRKILIYGAAFTS